MLADDATNKKSIDPAARHSRRIAEISFVEFVAFGPAIRNVLKASDDNSVQPSNQQKHSATFDGLRRTCRLNAGKSAEKNIARTCRCLSTPASATVA